MSWKNPCLSLKSLWSRGITGEMVQSDQTYTAVDTGSPKQVPPHHRICDSKIPFLCPALSHPRPSSQPLVMRKTEQGLSSCLDAHRFGLPCKWKITESIHCSSIIKKYWLKKQVQYVKKNICSESVGNTSLLLMHRVNVIPTLQFSSTRIPKASFPSLGKAVNSTLKWAAAHKNPRQNFQLLHPHSYINDTNDSHVGCIKLQL